MSQTLSQVLNFDDGDLASNRLGKLTEKQKSLLAEKYQTNKNKYLMVGILIIFMCFSAFLCRLIPSLLNITSISFFENGSFDPTSLTSILPFLVIGGILFLVFGTVVVLVLRVVFGKAKRQADTAVRRVEGKVNFVWVEREERNLTDVGPRIKMVRSLELRVGTDTTFNNINTELPNLIDQGDEWIFYYTNHPFKILSAEKVK